MNGRLENELKLDNYIDNKLIDKPKFLIEWNSFLKASGKTASTRKDYINKIIRFLDSINSNINCIKPEDITQGDVVSYFASIQITNNNGELSHTSDSYKQTIWSCLNSFLSFMYNSGYISENYILSIDRPKNKDLIRINHCRMHLNKDDFNSIYKAVCDGAGSEKAKSFQYSFKNRDIAIMLLFMTTGMRKTALITLNIQDIDFDNQSIIVVDKGEIEQKYTLNDLTMKYINLWMYDRDEYTDTEALFVSKEGTRLSGTGIDKIVKKYTKEGLGIELSPHKLRAGFASILYETKHDAEFVRKAIGHSNISTTLRYITTDNKEREESSKILGNVFG